MKRLLQMKDLILLIILLTAAVLSLPSNSLAVDPPTEGMVVWFAADAGVQQDGDGITVWQDQSGNNNHANRIVDPNLAGYSQLALAAFPNGNHYVIRFDGSDGLRLTNASATQLNDFNIFIVASYDEGSLDKRVFGNYSHGTGSVQYGYAFGTTGDHPMWWYGSSALTTGSYEAEKNYLTVYTLENSNYKELYNFHEVNGIGIGSADYAEETSTAPIQYHNDPELPPHYSDIGIVWVEGEGGWFGAHTGDIAEILVYDTTDPDFLALNDPNAAFDGVRDYVTEKYGMNTSMVPLGIEPDPDIDADLAAYWQFNETTGDIAADTTFNHNDGTLIGGFTFDSSSATDRLGNPSGALTFNGLGDWINVSHDASIDCFPQITIAAWIKSGEQKAYAELVTKDLEVSGTYKAYSLLIHSDQSIWWYTASGGGYTGNQGTPGSVTAGEWHHVAVTHDGTGLTIYLDGAQDGTKVSAPALVSTASAPLFIGKGYDPFGDRHWKGDIDEIAIWKGALTPEEIYYVYLNGVPLPPPGCKDIGVYFPTDLNQDCYVNLEDFALIAKNWLKCNDPQRPECTDVP